MLFQKQAAHSLGQPADSAANDKSCNPPKLLGLKEAGSWGNRQQSKLEAVAGWLLPTKAESCLESEGWGKGAKSSYGKGMTFANHSLFCTIETYQLEHSWGNTGKALEIVWEMGTEALSK